jgi:EAL domain-containing protein (putative c-di-GMP-specific phosphodiesterase class I)
MDDLLPERGGRRHAARLHRQAGRAQAAAGLGPVHPTDGAVVRLLDGAWAAGDLEVRYQPIFHLRSREVIGADATVRWPGAGRIDLERSAVTERLRDQVLADLAAGPAALARWWVRLPVSPHQLVSRAAIAELVDGAAQAGVSPGRLRIGVREPDLALAMVAGGLDHLADAGLLLDVAEFGVGGLCPSALRRVPVATIRVRLHGCRADDVADRALVSSMVEVAGSLGIEVVAEDIDADDELALVHDAGISLVQGDRWGTPGPLAKLLTTWSRPL